MLTILLNLILLADNFSIYLSYRLNDDIIDLAYFGPALFGKPIVNNGKLSGNEIENPEEHGSYLEGDLLHPSMTKNGMKAEAYRWKDGIVPFEIRGSFCKLNCF